MDASKRASKFRADKAFGRRSGFSEMTSGRMVSPPAARSTSWKILAKSRREYTARFTDLGIQVTTTLRRCTSSPAVSTSSTTFTCSRSNGNQEPFASLSIKGLCDVHTFAATRPDEVGFRSSVLYHLERCRRRRLAGPPDSTTVFPAAMLVDYVRVYRAQKAN